MSSPIPRNRTLDSLRGLAIVTMIAANLAGERLTEPHPVWLRLFGTFAAPFFIILSGMMIEIGKKTKSRGFWHFLKRGAWVFCVGMLVAILIWKVYPGTSMDVLYLIGLSLPITYLVSRLPNALRWMLIISWVGLGAWMQRQSSYCVEPTFISLHQPMPYASHAHAICKHWLIDGWFPLIPWLAFSWCGVQFESLRHKAVTHLKTTLALGLTAIAIGGSWWSYAHKPFIVRAGYSELFYPLQPHFFILCLGVCLVLFWLFQRLELGIVSKLLAIFGQSSLLIYVLHLTVIVYAFPHGKKLGLETVIYCYGVLISVLWLVAYGLSKKKKPTVKLGTV